MLYRLLPLLLIIVSPAVSAADTLDNKMTGIDQDAEQQRLNGYGWKLYDNMFNSDQGYLYSPLSHSPDIQLQVAALEQWDNIQTGGGRSPLWQDPERGLVSAIASYLNYNAGQHYRFGAEGEWYHGALTASGRAGYLHNTGAQPTYLYSDDAFETQPFAGVDLRWYATDNLSLQIGGETVNHSTMGNIRMEYQPGFDHFDGLSFFARAAHGDEDNEYVLGGVRYSFGDDYGDSPSLLIRDRGNPNAPNADRLSPEFKSLYYGQ